MDSPTIYPRMPDTDARSLFARILDRCSQRTAAGAPVLVLDLDGTLMDNRPRTIVILRDLAEQWKAKHPEAAAALKTCTEDRLAYLLSDSLRRLKIVDPMLVGEATEYWRSRF